MTDPHPMQPAANPGGYGPSLTRSEEVVTVGTEWIESGRIRLRRRITTETRTIHVTVRREELVVDTQYVDDHDGAMYGTRYDGPPIPPPSAQRPIRIVLHEEVPEVSLRLTPYELVTVTTGLLAGEVEVHEQRHREQLDLEHDNHPAN